jgi:hypothetical protein
MKTKLGMLTILMLLPFSLFSQSFYNDIYTPTTKPTAVKSSQQTQQEQQPTQNSTTTTSQEYQIETMTAGNQQAVIVRNAAGDTVYYSGDYSNSGSNGNTNNSAVDTIYSNGINDNVQQSNQLGLTLQLSNGNTTTDYPVDNVNWNINTFGGYPYYNSWMQPYFYNSYYPYGYYSPFSYYGSLNPWMYGGFYGDYWDMGWGFGWDSPYFYGGWGIYPYYGMMYNNWGYSHHMPFNYSENSRHNGLRTPMNGMQTFSSLGSRNVAGGSNTSSMVGTRNVNSNSGGRLSSTATPIANANHVTQTNARQNSNASTVNSINARGTSQNKTFWTNFLTRNGYNVGNVQYQSRSNGNYVQQNNSGGVRRVVVISSQSANTQNAQRNSTYRVQQSTSINTQRVERSVSNDTRTYDYTPSYNGGGRSEGSYGGGGGGYRGGGRR